MAPGKSQIFRGFLNIRMADRAWHPLSGKKGTDSVMDSRAGFMIK